MAYAVGLADTRPHHVEHATLAYPLSELLFYRKVNLRSLSACQISESFSVLGWLAQEGLREAR